MNIQNSTDSKSTGKMHAFGKPFKLIFGSQRRSATSADNSTENETKENCISTTNDKSNAEGKQVKKKEENTIGSLEHLEVTGEVFDNVLRLKETGRPSISSSGGEEKPVVPTNAMKPQTSGRRTVVSRSTSGKDLTNCNGIIQLCITKMSSYALRYLERSVHGTQKTKRRSRKTIPSICNTNRALMDPDTNCTDMTASDFGSSDEIYSGYISSNCTIDAPFDEEYSVEALKEKHGDGEELLVLVIQELNKLLKEREQLKDKLKMEHMLLKKARRRLSIIINDKTCKTVRMDLHNH